MVKSGNLNTRDIVIRKKSSVSITHYHHLMKLKKALKEELLKVSYYYYCLSNTNFPVILYNYVAEIVYNSYYHLHDCVTLNYSYNII